MAHATNENYLTVCIVYINLGFDLLGCKAYHLLAHFVRDRQHCLNSVVLLTQHKETKFTWRKEEESIRNTYYITYQLFYKLLS